MNDLVTILGIAGSLRKASFNRAAVRAAPPAVGRGGARARASGPLIPVNDRRSVTGI